MHLLGFLKAAERRPIGVARDRKLAETGKCGGRKSYAERDGGLVALAQERRGTDAGCGYVTPSGRPYSASAVASMLGKGGKLGQALGWRQVRSGVATASVASSRSPIDQA